MLRACFPPHRVSVIPNAVDASEFEPGVNAPARVRPGDPVTIVALSRLLYRKVIDILALVIPEICARHDHVRFVIGALGGACGGGGSGASARSERARAHSSTMDPPNNKY